MKKRTRSSRKPEVWLKRFMWGLVSILVLLIAVMVGYWFGIDQASKDFTIEREHTRHLLEQMEKISAMDDESEDEKKRLLDQEIENLKKKLEKDIMELNTSLETESLPKKDPDSKKIILNEPPISQGQNRNKSNAKLVIIIDDVSYERDVKAIKSIGLPLVMSFLPPTSRHPNSAILANKEQHYMVHLPLEAIDFDDEEPKTLNIDSSIEDIETRINTLKKLYPAAKYYNNHTGSKFTSDTDAVQRLMGVLKEKNIQFVDSRTIAKTKVPQVSREIGMRYLGRDVFLDHNDGIEYIKQQIRDAVNKAKINGTAIAIGHPRPNTIQALRESKEILNEVKLVYIDQI